MRLSLSVKLYRVVKFVFVVAFVLVGSLSFFVWCFGSLLLVRSCPRFVFFLYLAFTGMTMSISLVSQRTDHRTVNRRSVTVY